MGRCAAAHKNTPLQILNQSFRSRFLNPGLAACNPQVCFLIPMGDRARNPIPASWDVVYSCISDCEDSCLLLALQQGCEDSLHHKASKVGSVSGMCWVWSCTKHSGGSRQPFLAARLIWGQTCWSWIVTWQRMSKWLCPMMRTWRDQQGLMSTYLTSNTRWVEEKMAWGGVEKCICGVGRGLCSWLGVPGAQSQRGGFISVKNHP